MPVVPYMNSFIFCIALFFLEKMLFFPMKKFPFWKNLCWLIATINESITLALFSVIINFQYVLEKKVMLGHNIVLFFIMLMDINYWVLNFCLLNKLPPPPPYKMHHVGTLKKV